MEYSCYCLSLFTGNRGNHKLPVGIAVARQRTLTTPNKSSHTSPRITSPGYMHEFYYLDLFLQCRVDVYRFG